MWSVEKRVGMALQLRRSTSMRVRLMTTLIAAFALIAQPYIGVIASQNVNALAVTDHVVINEISPSPSSGSEWIELYNPTALNVVVDGWTLKDASNPAQPISGTIAAGGFRTFNVVDFNNSGDTAILSNTTNVVDTVVYSLTISNDSSYARTYDANDAFEIRSAASVTKNTTNGSAPATAPVCTYDFTAQKMWEVTWGYGFEDRNGGAPVFDMQSNGGLVSLNGGAVPSYMTPTWHWLYVTDNGNYTPRHYTYGFADGTTRTADVTFSDVNGCQIPTIVWGTQEPLPATAVTNQNTGETYDTLQEAIQAALAGNTLVINENLSTTSQITIDKPLTINGQGHTLTAAFDGTDTSNNSVLRILSTNNVTIDNLVVEGAHRGGLHGVNVFASQAVMLNNVTSRNNAKSGVAINASTVTVSNITTAGNGWHGINADKNGTILTVNGVSAHSEAFADIYVDDTTKNVDVVDTNSQYSHQPSGIPGRNNDQVYRLKPANTAPTVAFVAPTPSENSYVRGTITPHVTASDDYGMGSYYVRVWKNAFESGVSNLVYNGCSSAPGAALLGTAQDVTCPALNTTTLTDGKYVLSAQFLDSSNVWGQSLRTFYVDNTAPTITVKAAPDTVGSTASKTFSKVSFKLHDNIKFEGKYTINGVESTISPSTWGDANNIVVGQRGAVYGENTITLKDLAGNSASYTFILDNLAPTIKIKDGFVGSKEANTFSNVSFSLFDAHQVDKYTINGHTSDFGNNNWSDANFQNIKQYLNQGLNTFALYDIAGNKSTFEFTYDTTAPGASFTHSNNNDNTLVNTDVVSTLHATEPIQTPAGWTLVADTDNKTFTKTSTENNKGNIVITDLAGNSSTVFFEVKRIDKTAPVFNISNADVLNTSSVNVLVTETNLASTIKVDGVDTAYTGTKPNYKVSVTGEGTHTVTATDKAGNATTVTFTIDSTAPSVSWQLQPKTIYGIGQGFNIRPITSEVGTIKSVYIDSVNSANLVRTLASDHKNFDTSNAHNQTLWDSLSDGIHKFIAVFEDYAGNVTTSESSSFTIDRTAPDGSFTFSNNKAPTKGNVYAYLTTTEPVTISPTGSHGWEATDATHFKHKFTNNGSFDAVITDAAGNSKTLTASVDWIDRTAPSVTQYAYSNNGNLTKNDVTVTITTSEPVDTPTDWNRVDDTHFTRVFEHNGGFTVSLTDKVGNTATVGGKSQGAEVKGIDKNAPIISGITEGAIVSNAVQLSVFDPKYEGADGFNANTGLNVDGEWVVTTPGADKTYLYEVTGEGLHTVFATDKAGNVTDTLHFTIDTTPPEMTLNAIATSTSTSRTITGTGDAGETVEVTVHSTPQTKTTTVDQMGVWSVTFDNLEVGLHTVKATIFDALGNRSEEVIGSFKVLAVTVPTETDPETNNPDTNNASDTPTTAGANAAGTPSQASNLAGLGLAVLGVSTTANEVAQAQSPAEEESDVKGTSTAGSDTDTNKQSEAGCGTFLGICWYWWIPIVIAAIIAVYYLFRPRREEA